MEKCSIKYKDDFQEQVYFCKHKTLCAFMNTMHHKLVFFFFFIISHWSYYMKFGVSNSMTNNVVLLWNMVLCSLADQHQCFRRIDWLEQRHHFL